MKYRKKFLGFTIVEMLVVVAIIGILATIMTINVGNSVVKSRDSKRMADITMINKAIGLYAAEKREFPRKDPCTFSGNTSKCIETWQIVQGDATMGSTVDPNDSNDWIPGSTFFVLDLKTYLPTLPTDPKNQSAGTTPIIYYHYLYSSDQSTYYLRARLELDNNAGNFGTKKCFGFLGAKNSSISLTDWGTFLNATGPINDCVPATP